MTIEKSHAQSIIDSVMRQRAIRHIVANGCGVYTLKQIDDMLFGYLATYTECSKQYASVGSLLAETYRDRFESTYDLVEALENRILPRYEIELFDLARRAIPEEG